MSRSGPALPWSPWLLAGFTLLFSPLLGCSDSVDPEPLPRVDPVGFEGSLNPGAGEFVLQELDGTPTGSAPLRLQLIGRNLQVDATASSVSLDVAIRNLSSQTLYPEIIVWLSAFLPPNVVPVNADLLPPAGGTPDSMNVGPWGFRYGDLLGGDGKLDPSESSGFKSWRFYDPGLVAFSFSASLEFALRPPAATVGGTVFHDDDADGVFDPDESGLGAGGVIFADGPGRDETLVLEIGADGRYAFPATEPGLYTLRYIPPPTLAPFAPILITTPNPLEILLPPGPDGLPRSFLEAHFGIHSPSAGIQLVKITELEPEQIETDPYRLGGAWLRGSVLILDRLAYSGCSGGHPFELYFAGGFAETNVVQATLVLSHDDRNELCDAYFEERRYFELSPLIDLYPVEHPDGGAIRLILLTPGGRQELMLLF